MHESRRTTQNGHSRSGNNIASSPSHQDRTRVAPRSHQAPTVSKPGWRLLASDAPPEENHQEMTQFHVREGFTAIIQDMLQQPDRETQFHINGTHLLVALVLMLILAARAANIQFNTLFLDEAIYATVGEDVEAGVFKQGATSWMFGSYLYPILASTVDQVGGIAALRITSALLTTGAAVLVYLMTRRLFDAETGLWALLLFGLSGISISLGQQAVLDALGMPLLALAIYWIARAFRPQRRQNLFFALAGFTFSLSVLAKYIALLTLPTLVLFIIVLHLYEGGSLWSVITRLPWLSFFIPMVIVLGIYGAFYFDDLVQVASGQFASQAASRWEILGQILQDIGVPIVLSLIGMAILAWNTIRQFSSQWYGLLIMVLPLPLMLLLLGLLILPFYHLVDANARSLWKHNVYTLLLIAPLAGYALAQMIRFVRSLGRGRSVTVRLISAVVTLVVLIWFAGSALRQNQFIQGSWPNNADEIAFIKTQNLSPDSRILSPSYAIYEYYFDTGVNDRNLWNNVWYTEYGSATGTEAIRQSIQDCAYDLIVLDNYYAPEWSGTLEPLVQAAGYVIIYSTAEEISTGDTIITDIYQLPEGSTCKGGV